MVGSFLRFANNEGFEFPPNPFDTHNTDLVELAYYEFFSKVYGLGRIQIGPIPMNCPKKLDQNYLVKLRQYPNRPRVAK